MDLLFKASERPYSLVGRSLIASVSALLVVMILLGTAITAVLAFQTEPFSWEGVQGQERRVMDEIRFDSKGNLEPVDLDSGDLEIFDALPKDIAFQLLDASGNEILSSPQGPALEVLRRQPLKASGLTTPTARASIPLEILTTTLERNGKQYLLRNARSDRLALGIRSNGKDIVYAAAIGTGILAVLVFTVIALWMARRTAKPLKEASEAAAAIHPRNIRQRVDRRNLPSEITPLIDAFNSALERLERGYRVQQEFLAAAAHELKTPLALMRAEIELGNGGNSDLLLKDIDSMAIQVQQLLQLAEVSEFQNFQFEPVDVRHVVEEAVVYADRFAMNKSVHLRFDIEGNPAPASADAGALSTLLRNLLENAIHFSPKNGIVTIVLTSTFISVSDEGPGVPGHEIPNLFSRFWRGENARHPGAGLGLSICQMIANAHEWTLAYQQSGRGPGAEFRVTF